MKRSVFIFIALMFSIMAILAACGGGDDASETTADSDTSEDTEAAAEEDESDEEAESGEKYKVGILAPAVTHGWVAAVAYYAENRAEELSDEIEYKIQTSSDAAEMTAQL